MKRGGPGDPIFELTLLREDRKIRIIRMVWSHRFYWRPRKRTPDPSMYHWGVWWLWFYIGSRRADVTRDA